MSVRSPRRLLTVLISVSFVLSLELSPYGAGPVRADGPFIINVTTASDVAADDGLCSLREAIGVSNTGGFSGVNFGECQGSTSSDSIRFALGGGTPAITLGSALPDITQPVTIRGNTGGATRVQVAGAGSGFAIRSTASGTYIGSMVMDGIYVDGADNVTIVSNVVRSINGGGNVNNLRIGGSNPATPNPCSGDCNLIVGNTNGDGIYFGSAGGTITGNFIGVDATGNVAAPNRSGILITSGAFTIGGTTPDLRNVISGNTREGMVLHACTCIVQGNYVGTNAAGTAAIPNGMSGIKLDLTNATVGGSAPGAGNVISGNTGDGIYSENADKYSSTIIEGNRIGTKAGGGALGNGGNGINLNGPTAVQGAMIGSATTPEAANVIAYNGGSGVRMSGANVKWNMVRGNSIHHNAAEGISLESTANSSISPPVITGLAPLTGTACANCIVDVYSDSSDEGQVFEGTATADGAGNWSYPAALSGPKVTATNTQFDQFSHGWTSEFSSAYALPVPKRPDGRIRKGTGTLVGDNIYNLTGLNQTRTGSTTRGNTITFGISLQNDGSSDQFSVQATGASTSMYTVRYFRNSTEITAAIVAGTFTTPVLGPGDSFLIKATVKVNSSATTGSSVTRLVTITSLGDANKKDAVKLVGKRS